MSPSVELEVPFHSSGALSRAHYTIVRKVETAPSVQTADQHIFLEISSIEGKLMHPRLSTGKCKECLVVLLYCATCVTPGFLASDAFNFAFSHAINLAEAGRNIEDKRIGYLFCSEIMPKDHPLRLMLVNTIRKDLESSEIARICLALDNLITTPNEDVIPAVQSRLHDLLSHDDPLVKRRALFTFGALSELDPAILERVQPVIVRRLKDNDGSVVTATLALLSAQPPQDESFRAKARDKVNRLLGTESSFINDNNAGIILQALKAIRTFGLSDTTIQVLFEIVREHSHPKAKKSLSKAIVLEVFKTLGTVTLDKLSEAEKSTKVFVVPSIRHWLSSLNPNENYLFMSCLECVDVALWSGTQPDRPALLDADEFEKIMTLLGSPDRALLRKTAGIVNKVDPSILDMQISLTLDAAVTAGKLHDVVLSAILDMILIRHGDDGAKYASRVVEFTERVDSTGSKPHVSKGVVESVLTTIRNTPPDFSANAASQMMQSLIDLTVQLGPTALVIVAALTTEYIDSVSNAPSDVMAGLAERLKTCQAIVQEPCLIAMLRAAADCKDVPSDVIDIVNQVSHSARPLVRARCAQFLEFTQNREKLLEIVKRAASSSLPDFLLALQQETGEEPTLRSSASTPQSVRPMSRSSVASSSLKYAAYAPPQVGPRLKVRRRSSSQQSLSTTSHTTSQMGSPPLTAGQLALATGLEEIHIRDNERIQAVSHPAPVGPHEAQATLIDLQAPRADLISLESPFHAEPLADTEHSENVNTEQPEDFGGTWHALETGSCDLRGWCKDSIDKITKRLEGFDAGHRLTVVSAEESPFKGELKILILSLSETINDGSLKRNVVAIRLRKSDEDSCLWRLRCAEANVGIAVQRLLDGEDES